MSRLCRNCGKDFEPKRTDQRFCNNGGKCRNEWYQKNQARDGIPVKIAGIRPLKSGMRSVTLHIPADQASRTIVQSILPGQPAKLILETE